ncbi:transposase [Halobellus inordinatus]|uniref:transposase n=1 Tax=Halobellus inordinatus TaxID=1126236 RepID=UPI00210EB56C
MTVKSSRRRHRNGSQREIYPLSTITVAEDGSLEIDCIFYDDNDDDRDFETAYDEARTVGTATIPAFKQVAPDADNEATFEDLTPRQQNELLEKLDRRVFDIAADYPMSAFEPELKGGSQKSRGTNIDALCRAYYAKCLHPGLDSRADLVRFLQHFEGELEPMGFEADQNDPYATAPSRGAIGRFCTQRVTPGTLDRIEQSVNGFRRPLAKEFGLAATENPDAMALRKEAPVSNEEVRRAYRQLVGEFDAVRDERDQARITHPQDSLFSILSEASANKTSCSDMIEDRDRPEEQREYEHIYPHLDNEPGDISIKGFFEALDANSATGYMKDFEQIFRNFLKRAKRNGMFARPVDVIIDGTDFVFHPKNWEDGKPQLPEGTVGTKGGEQAYKFITISVYDRQHNKTMKPVVFPMRERSLRYAAVHYLVEFIRDFMSVREVFADSAFASGPILNYFEKEGIDYTCRFRMSGSKIKTWIKGLSGQRITGARDYTINRSRSHPHRHETRLIARRVKRGKTNLSLPESQTPLEDFVSDSGQLELEDFEDHDVDDYDGPWFVYVTSHDVPNERESVQKKLKDYAKRWNVETDYRVVKQNFMPFTNTDKYAIRVLFWLWAVALYNAWVLVDMLIKIWRGWDLAGDYRIRSKPFRREITAVDYG